MKTSDNGKKLIKKYEGFSSTPYLCPAKVPTIGYGATYYPNGKAVTLKDTPITEKQADEMLSFMLVKYENAVSKSKERRKRGILEMKTVAEIQALLKKNGLYNGSIDSLVGNQTIKATQIAQQKGLLPLDDVNTIINFKNNDDRLKISQNFYLSELLKSETAVRFGINNTPSKEHKQHLIESTIYLWQPTRELLKFPMIVSSGYRSRLLNNKVGGSSTSAHSHGYAIDFDCPSFGSTRQIASFLVNEFKAGGIAFDQIILEYPDSHSSWIHLGYKQPNTNKQRNQVLTAVKVNGTTKYLSGLH